MQSVHELLDKLGKTRDEVAKYLREREIKGKKCMGSSCPVTNYLKSNGYKKISTQIDCVKNQDAGRVDSLPQPVMDFIEEFDMGHKFDDLEQ